MKLITRALLSTFALAALSSCKTTEDATPPAKPIVEVAQKMEALLYPTTREDSVSDNYHGVEVKDPYRWLEDQDAPEVAEWVKAQNKVSFGFLEKIPERETYRARIEELWNYEKYSAPFKEGARYYYYKNDGLQNQSVLYKLAGLDQKPEVLLDPNAWSKEGTTSLGGLGFSDDGKFLAYSKSEGGSDWRTWSVINTETNEVLKDKLEWSKFSGAEWTHDNAGFFYSRYPAPKEGVSLEDANFFQQLYYHRLGTEQSADVLVYEDKEHKTRGFYGSVTDDGKSLVIYIWDGTDRRNRIHLMPLEKTGAFKKAKKTVKLLDAFDAGYSFLGNNGDVYYFSTDKDAPKGKVVAIDVKDFAPKNWKTLIPEREDKLEYAKLLNGGFLVNWLHQAHDKITFHSMDGVQEREIDLPTVGSASGFAGKKQETETFYTFTSFTYPSTVFHLDLTTGKSTVFRKPAVSFNPDEYEAKQVTYASKDGTKIPMFIVHKKGVVLDGSNKTLLYGYGGFNVSLTPSFSASRLAWLEKGYVYAQPSLRGGGEFGEAWHQAGMLDKKQNVFDDFVAAAQYLIDEKYTRSESLGISGRSNGGLLVGASITQRPDLFGGALAGVGVLDMYRYHKFTIGHAWVNEYGSSDDAAQFKTLAKYSPLHNTKKGSDYPATMIITADHDDRVVPAHSFKFGAQLQKDQGGSAPIIIRIDTKAGHGAGKSTKMYIEGAADEWTFLDAVLK